MNLHHYLDSSTSDPVHICVIGAGGFGRSFILQGQRIPALDIRIAVDIDAEAAARAFIEAGIDEGNIRICRSPAQARRAWRAEQWIATDRLENVLELPLHVVVEATGHPEAGACHAIQAIEAGCHLALVSKEVDSVIGPGLARMARDRGCLVTPVDGDQPSLLIGLVSWAETLGLDIIGAGKASEYDFIFDEGASTLTSNGRTIGVPGFDALWHLRGDPVMRTAQRAEQARALPQRAVPDLCELALVANATDFDPDIPALHCPIARISEVAELFRERALGGLFSGSRRLDVFHCLRRPDEFSLAGGVFVTVQCHDRESWQMLAEKGHLVSRDGRTATLVLPRHLLGLEAATSLLEVTRRGIPSGALQPLPRFDLIAVAERDLPAGTELTAHGHHHSIDDVGALLLPGTRLSGDSALPYYLAANRQLSRAVRAGEPIRVDDIILDESAMLWRLRLQQDAMGLPEAIMTTAGGGA